MTLKLNGSTAGSVSIDAPADTSPTGTDVTLTLPTSAGSSGQYLQTNGSGTLSWQTVEGLPDAIDVNASAPADSVNIDSSGRLLVGTSTNRTKFYAGNSTFSPAFQVERAASTNDRGTSFVYNSNDEECPIVILGKSRGTSVNSFTVVQNSDLIGRVSFQGADGTNLVEGAKIEARVDGTPGSNDMPGRLTFWTTRDAGTDAKERTRISADGGTSCFADNTGNYVIRNAMTGTGGTPFRVVTGSTDITDGNEQLVIRADGDVENSNGSYTQISDVSLKENIVDANSQWSDIKQLQIRNFNFKESTGFSTHKQIGLVAQEVETICPGLVKTRDRIVNEETKETVATKSVNSSVLYMKAVKALQEAMERIEVLETANASLEARLTALEGGAS